ncbi:MAG: enoyl-CoA hydratase/isomerase family protein [Candidatus Brocadiaceae bacterium]|nr:enoyl-CoA hydratase/isomerase family protein [Candidatus Brocadiaceae bacterium]
MNLKYINFSETDHVCTICLHPLDNGFFDKKVMLELGKLLDYITDESPCKFIVIKGTDKGFTKGLKIQNFDNEEITIDDFRRWEIMINRLETLNKITIAVIDGECLGAGIQLALSCDYRIATNNSQFAHNEVQMGILPGHTIFQLSKFCGLNTSLELIATGRFYTAQEAMDKGIVNRVCEDHEIEDETAWFLQQFKDTKMDIYYLARRLLKEAHSMSYEDFLGSYLAAQHRVIS